MESLSSTAWATGRRKTATARIRLIRAEGDPSIEINGRKLDDYFPTEALQTVVTRPLVLTEKVQSYTIKGVVRGGGVSAQAGALSHGISRALIKVEGELRPTLKAAHLLTRDARSKERKKYGQKGARKRFQFSKR